MPNGHVPGLLELRQKARTFHIALGVLKGKTLFEIEPKSNHSSLITHVTPSGRLIKSAQEIELDAVVLLLREIEFGVRI